MSSVKLYQHQQVALNILRRFSRYALFMEMGMGKTLTVLSLVKERGHKTLVVCPLSIIADAWQSDCEKLGITFCNLWALKKGQPIPEAQVYAINYDRVAKSFKMLLALKPDCLIIDESTYIKNNKAQRTKAMISLADNIPNVYIMSGNPAPNSYLELWPQMRCISPAILGGNFYAFRNKWFYPSGYQGYNWRITQDNAEKLLDRVKHYAVYMRKEDWLDLPEKQYIYRHVQFDKEMFKAYELMRKHRIAELGDELIISRTAAVQILRLREITSGFVMDGDAVQWISDAKINELKHLLEEISGQVFIWVNFRAEAKRLQEELGCPCILGGINEETKQQYIAEFKQGKHRVLVATIGTISHGVTLTNCHHVIYYSLTYSLDQYLQSQDRFHRIGQYNPVSYYHLLVEGSVDEAVLKVLQKKTDIQTACAEALKIVGKNT